MCVYVYEYCIVLYCIILYYTVLKLYYNILYYTVLKLHHIIYIYVYVQVFGSKAQNPNQEQVKARCRVSAMFKGWVASLDVRRFGAT